MGSLSFNIFFWNIVFLSWKQLFHTDYTDDSTPYVIVNDAEEVVFELKTIL